MTAFPGFYWSKIYFPWETFSKSTTRRTQGDRENNQKGGLLFILKFFYGNGRHGPTHGSTHFQSHWLIVIEALEHNPFKISVYKKAFKVYLGVMRGYASEIIQVSKDIF